jgi:type II secretory pathway pseudopilin PulG
MAKAGYSLIEVLFVLSAAATLGAMALPPFFAALDEYRTAGAVRYICTRLQRTRMEAASRSTNVAMQFDAERVGYSFSIYADGNGDGVRTPDIKSGIDSRLAAIGRVPDNYAGVDFGLLAGLPPVEASEPPPGTDPIKLGSSDLLSYSSTGSSSTGSLYIKGNKAQYVIRILGDTGRTRVLKFDRYTRRWKAL